MRDRLGAVLKRRKLKHTHRTVPDDGACLHQLSRQRLRGFGANVQNQVVIRHVGRTLHGGNGVGLELLGRHHIGGDGHGCAAGLHGLDHRPGLGQQIGLGQALADLQAGGQHEGVGDAAAHNQLIDVIRQTFENGQLGRDFGARHDGHQRTLGRQQGGRDGVHFRGQQRAGAGYRRKLGDAVGAGFGAVSRAECVVYKDVAQRSHLF